MVPPPRTGADEVKSRLEGLSGGSPTWPWEGLHRNTPSGRVCWLQRKIINLMQYDASWVEPGGYPGKEELHHGTGNVGQCSATPWGWVTMIIVSKSN